MNSVCTLSIALALPALALVTLTACEKKAEPSKPASATAPAKPADSHADHDHKDGDDHDHDKAKPTASKPADAHEGHDHGDGHDHGATTQLGEQTAGSFIIKASRDGAITPGKDAAIDAWVTGGTAKVAAVRFWIGTQDGKGSMKAKADLEKDNWHTHAEIPSPLPAGSKLWVEVEDDKGTKTVVGFDLKA